MTDHCIIVGAGIDTENLDLRYGTLYFGIGDKEYLRVEEDGGVYVFGRLAGQADDPEALDAFKQFIRDFARNT